VPFGAIACLPRAVPGALRRAGEPRFVAGNATVVPAVEVRGLRKRRVTTEQNVLPARAAPVRTRAHKGAPVRNFPRDSRLRMNREAEAHRRGVAFCMQFPRSALIRRVDALFRDETDGWLKCWTITQ
jgi:hypothetical protein